MCSARPSRFWQRALLIRKAVHFSDISRAKYIYKSALFPAAQWPFGTGHGELFRGTFNIFNRKDGIWIIRQVASAFY